MTDLPARLRDVLSDEVLDECFGNGEIRWSDIRNRLIAFIGPAVSSLLEEREREIREALKMHGPCLCGGSQLLVLAIEARLASSSSPAAPQEQK